MAICTCDNPLLNTGQPNCFGVFGVTQKLIFVPYSNGAGVRNGFDLTAIPDNTGIIALLNAADATERYYPIPEMENVDKPRGESLVEEAPSGRKVKIKAGTKTFTGEIWEQGAVLAGALDSASCSRIGVYEVDQDGKVRGEYDSITNYIYPAEIAKGSLDIIVNDATDSTVPKVVVNFDYADRLLDSDFGYLETTDFDGANWLEKDGLIDLYGQTPTGISTTGFTMKINTKYGSKGSPVVQSGLSMSDFSLYNTTQAASVTLLTAVESPSGTYAFTFAAQTSADVLNLSIDSGTNGFDDTNLTNVDITIP